MDTSAPLFPDQPLPPTGLALFGMSADPPTKAHQEIMGWLAPQFRTVIVWAADNPFKSEQTSLHHRQAMLGLLVGELQSTYPQVQHQPALSYPYTLHSVQAAHRYWPHGSFTLVVGSDILAKLGQWHQVELLFQLVDFLVLDRPGAPIDPAVIHSLTIRGGRFHLADFTGPDISSTASRQAAQPENLLPVIAQYVSQHGLYQITPPSSINSEQRTSLSPPARDKAEFTVGVDNVVFAVDSQHNQLLVLLSQRQQPPYQGWYGLPGTLVRAGEGLEAAAYRILAEKIALRTLYLEQLYSFDGLGKRQPFTQFPASLATNSSNTSTVLEPNIRYLSVSYFALIPYGATALMVSVEAGGAWFSVDDVPPLAFDHADILAYGHRRLKNKLQYSPVAFDVLPPKFTLNEVYQFYSTVLGENFADYSNFRSRLLKLGILKETGEKVIRAAGRPASLYQFDPIAFAPLQDTPLIFV